MRNGYFKFVSQKTKSIFIFNLLLVFIFASLYYIQDYIISYYPDFSEKYLLEYEKKNFNNNSKFTLKPFIYYIWFSLITQSTVGYTGIITQDNKTQSFNNIRSIPFKILNILQITSIFIVPSIVL
tara:strand:+ start:152 stop:526 length:375 start_codon:yes stop_codon:yes gene_type:complete